jgi:hypothetical protein
MTILINRDRELRKHYSMMGLDDESVDYVIRFCADKTDDQLPVLASVMSDPRGRDAAVGRLIWKESPWRIGGNINVRMRPDFVPKTIIYASLDALATAHGYDSEHWTADELAIDLVMSAPALDGRDPVELEPACEAWLKNRRKG